MWDWIINKLGCCRTCADCKYLEKCWRKIDEYALDTPACENFEESESDNI